MNGLEQQISEWFSSLGWTGECVARLLLALLAGGLVGLEREVRGRQAGFRTNLLVCLGSALTMVVSISFARHRFPYLHNININVDPARIAYGVMTGIGFLGAGTIVHSQGSVRGLTTAAALWCVAAVGLGIGSGLYSVSISAVLMIVLALWLLDYLEERIPKVRYRTVTVRRHWVVGVIVDTVKYFTDKDMEVVDVSFDRTADLESVDIHLKVAFTNRRQYYSVERALQGESEIKLLSTREM